MNKGSKLYSWEIPNPCCNVKYTKGEPKRGYGIIAGIIWADSEDDAMDKINKKFSSDDCHGDLIYKYDIPNLILTEIDPSSEFAIIGDYRE